MSLHWPAGRACEKARSGGMEGEDQEKTKDQDCGQRARRLGPTFILHIKILYYSLCIHHVASLARGLHCIYVSLVSSYKRPSNFLDLRQMLFNAIGDLLRFKYFYVSCSAVTTIYCIFTYNLLGEDNCHQLKKLLYLLDNFCIFM